MMAKRSREPVNLPNPGPACGLPDFPYGGRIRLWIGKINSGKEFRRLVYAECATPGHASSHRYAQKPILLCGETRIYISRDIMCVVVRSHAR